VRRQLILHEASLSIQGHDIYAKLMWEMKILCLGARICINLLPRDSVSSSGQRSGIDSRRYRIF
jgi:hypothetical protein